MPDMPEALIEEVVECRKKSGLSQKKLADLSGVKQSVIARMERSVHSPQIDTLLRLLRPLGYTLKVVPIELPTDDTASPNN